MAKETMIVFVYDTECLKDEADDPVNAVLYFHPSWVSDTQKVALCGQLMGTSYFLKDCFFKPRIISLQNGKFILKEFGRFILAVGTDRNISDSLLEHRAELLASLVRFFHRDLQTIYDQFSLSGQYKNLSEKLYHIFETYLPILQHKGNVFQNIPKLRMPKPGSNIFLDAIQTLQYCQQTKGVLGGVILHHNKVIATQLSDQITKQLVLTDPLHIRIPAEQITNPVDFHVPNGVHMLVIYIDSEQYRKLAAEANRAQNFRRTFQGLQNPGNMSFQHPKRKMKRDKSLIFTNIPEESSTTVDKDHADHNTEGATAQSNDPAEMTTTTTTTTILNRPKSLNRPTHLPLRFKNVTSRDVPESGIASINFDENDSFPEFIGRTSVCSTPMTENKVLQVENIMSICANPEMEQKPPEQPNNNRRNSLKLDLEKFFQNFITNPNKMERRNSFSDLQDSIKKLSKKFSLKSKSTDQKTDVNRNGSCSELSDFIENDDNHDEVPSSGSENSDVLTKAPRTITDPTYPVFNTEGHPISRSLFQEFIERYYKLWDADTKEEAEIEKLIEEFKEFDNELKKLNETLTKDIENPTGAFKADSNLNIEGIEEVAEAVEKPKAKTPLDKKSLSLPLKPLADATPSENNALPFGSGPKRKQPGAIPLTPLMAKLSVLAQNEERSSAFSNWDVTPGGIEIQTPLDGAKVFRRRSSSVKCEEAADALGAQNTSEPTDSTDGLQRVELYVCGQQNMTLLLLMEKGCGNDQKIVQSLFDICVAKFPHMETELTEVLNLSVEGDKSEGGYSFFCVDTKWDALNRNGPWNPVELNTLETIHRNMQINENITDVILRANDTVFYGYRCGRTEFFYKEPVHQTTGIPPPSDPMGNVAMRAKSRLERDHSYNLL